MIKGDYMNGKIVRPKGLGYIIYTSIIYIFLAFMAGFMVFGLLYEDTWGNANVVVIGNIFLLVVLAIMLFLIALKTREVIRYKMIISDDFLYLAANRDLYLTRHKDIRIGYEGIKALQYRKMMRPDLIDKGMFFFSAIYITRENAKKKEYLLTQWFSDKQAQEIIMLIKENAEKCNGNSVEILPAEIE
jgi:hypothetical protein